MWRGRGPSQRRQLRSRQWPIVNCYPPLLEQLRGRRADGSPSTLNYSDFIVASGFAGLPLASCVLPEKVRVLPNSLLAVDMTVTVLAMTALLLATLSTCLSRWRSATAGTRTVALANSVFNSATSRSSFAPLALCWSISSVRRSCLSRAKLNRSLSTAISPSFAALTSLTSASHPALSFLISPPSTPPLKPRTDNGGNSNDP